MKPAPPFPEPSQDELLRAIGETALDLANVGDREVMLGAILRRTRQLLAADMAYFSLNDLHSGTTYIQLTDGVRTPEYRAIRMPFGTGILGRAAAGAETVATADYLADRSLNHLSGIDVIVRGEGVRAIAGAPMRLGGRVVGALLVAHRAPRTLGPAARSALEHMAVQAAVALEQTRRGEEIRRLRTTRDDGSDPGARLRLEHLLQLDERLMGAMAGSTAEAAGVFAVLADSVGHPLSLHDPTGALRMGRRLLTPEELAGWRLRSAVRTSQQGGGVAIAHLPGGGTYALLAITTAGEHLATLVMEGADDDAVARLAHASAFVTVALLVERALAEADEAAQTTLVEEIVDSRVPPRPTLGSRLAHYGVSPDAPATVLVLDVDPASAVSAARTVRSLDGAGRWLVSVHDGHVCVIAGGRATRACDAGPRPAAAVADGLAAAGVTALVGTAYSPTGGPADLRRAHSEATDVAAAARALGRTAGHADYASLGAVGAVIRDRTGTTAREIVDRHLGPVLDYDRRRRTRLADTLWHWFAAGELLVPAAEALSVHPNTVRQRLERIDDLLGDSWRTPEGRFHVHLALRLQRATAPPGPPG
ncbi:helix-turn-helix domain-containing protein [Pseudonocardia sp. C8]|uniref:helix-turn-helix domain-containing protein n=1 Tax=Pseudonocardia sp. C8 TaxID=2762759 RepID=UPI001642ADB3|nr:helix-turn-helix domain-containing protein [Pseudonocardia sp. C8]MBC3193806.1 helix-turn-helix domain-containing protein [Pseudonocardia sp. C8]